MSLGLDTLKISDGVDDEIEQAIMNMMGVDRISTEEQIRKFRNLKILVLYLQREKKFGRYCYYGCYCLPEGSHDIASGGYGQPQDGIDRACFDFKQCYRTDSTIIITFFYIISNMYNCSPKAFEKYLLNLEQMFTR